MQQKSLLKNTMEFQGNQKIALEAEGNLVITASPGSGKTTVLSEKIRRKVTDKDVYVGIIAISYTNKASNNLRDRCSRGGLNLENCYFGTIDKFCISEIIIPFANKISKSNLFNVILWSDLVLKDDVGIKLHPNEPCEVHDNDSSFQIFLDAGYIVLELAAETAGYVLKKSLACKKYLTSKYTHVVVDEYQDCNAAQHTLVSILVDLGLTAIAAGDAEQSIFKFAKKDPKFLTILTKRSDFQFIPITENFRSHASIVEFANNFRSKIDVVSLDRSSSCVIKVKVDGDEFDILNLINNEIAANHFDVANCSIGIFYTSNDKCARASRSVDNSIYFQPTPIDRCSTIHSLVFIQILSGLQQEKTNSYEFASLFFNEEFERAKFQNTRAMFSRFRAAFVEKKIHLHADEILDFSRCIAGVPIDKTTSEALLSTLNEDEYIRSYAPTANGVPYILTYHKAKGLEFDVVFMPDLYQYILPNTYHDMGQEENVFYVGVTRPKKLLFLITSSKRHLASGALRDARESEFLSRNGGLRFCRAYSDYLRDY